MELPYLFWGHSEPLFKEMVKMAGVLIAHGSGDLPDGQRCFRKELEGMVQADILDIFPEGLPPVFLQDKAEIIPMIVKDLFQAVERYICVVKADVALQLV